MSRAKAISMKLLKVSQNLGVTNQTVLIRFFHERLLYRVSVSPFREKLLLKGGNLMYLFLGNKTRPTIDIDFSGQQLTNDIEKIRPIFIDILSISANDEVLFVTDRMNISPINEQNKYIGIRIKVIAVLGNIRQNIQIDIGYGDIISPAPISINYPVLLKEFDAPVILAYTVETVIAEKLHAIMELAQLNSRMKDFYDIYTLMNAQLLNVDVLKQAIRETFENRHTILNPDSNVFSEDFYKDENRNKMWSAYLRKINSENISFDKVIINIKQLVKSVIN